MAVRDDVSVIEQDERQWELTDEELDRPDSLVALCFPVCSTGQKRERERILQARGGGSDAEQDAEQWELSDEELNRPRIGTRCGTAPLCGCYTALASLSPGAGAEVGRVRRAAGVG